MPPRMRSIGLVLAFGSLASCSRKPTQEECKAGIIRMMEIQVDALNAPGSATSAMFADLTEAERRMQAQFLKSQAPSLVTPTFVAACVDRVKASDLKCTMSASNPDELVKKCHWKVGSGGKGGATLGF